MVFVFSLNARVQVHVCAYMHADACVSVCPCLHARVFKMSVCKMLQRMMYTDKILRILDRDPI